jgi:multidrug efflux system outer membrane protein
MDAARSAGTDRDQAMNPRPMSTRSNKAWLLRGAAVTAATLMISACTLEPTYRRPALPVQQTWPDGAPLRATPPQTAAADVGWRDFFSDPALQRLIEIALVNNRDARIAAINVAAARAQYRIQRADLFPSINATGVEDVERYPSGVSSTGATGGGGAAGGTGTTGTASGGGGGNIVRYYSAGIGFTSYELDLFGRIRSLNHQKLEQYFGYVETQRSAQISLIAEVANAWLTVLADQKLLAVTQQTLDSQQKSYALTKLSYDGGVLTQLDLRQAETSVDTAQANLALYTRQLAQDRNALVVLLGAPIPADLPAGAELDSETLLVDLPAGLPSDLLIRRPDVLSAEHNLVAANANIGAARAAFFPSISLTGNFGSASSKLDGLFKDGSSSWTFEPQISIPIFAGGANAANLDLAKIEKNLYVAQYEQTIQTAFREVADALVGRDTLNDQLAAQVRLVAASQDAYQLSDLRFRNGVDNYLTVLDSQRSLYTAQQGAVSVRLSQLQNRVTLYKALGGGWNEQTVETSTTAAADASGPGTASR